VWYLVLELTLELAVELELFAGLEKGEYLNDP
jgi:hypothetical protein